MVNLPSGKDVFEQISYVKDKLRSRELKCSEDLYNILEFLMIGGADNVLRNVKIIKKRNSIYHREYMELLKKEKKEGNG